MKIDWAALIMVSGISITASVIFIVLLAFGIRLVSAARLTTNQGGSGARTLTAGYGLLGVAGLLVLIGLYLIVPQFH
jgi:hypothetical protein